MADAVSEIERELMSLAELRLTWRRVPDAIEMIDAAMSMLTILGVLNDAEPTDVMDEAAFRLASHVRDVLQTLDAG